MVPNMKRILSLTLLFAIAAPAVAQRPFGEVAREVNKKLVKVYGSGGYRGLPAYGSGILISPKGLILTSANHLLDTPDLRVPLYDGRKFQAKVGVIEPQLDTALIKLDLKPDQEKDLDLPF